MAHQHTTTCSDLVQTTAPGQKCQALVETLTSYVNVDAIAEKEGCSKVECLHDETKTLKEIWTEFMEEIKKIPNIIGTIVPGGNSLSKGVRLLVFQAGWSSFYELVDKDDCIVLIPIVVSGSAEGTLYDYTTKRQTTITLKAKSELLIAGRCALWLQPQSKVVCVVMCIGKGNRRRDNEGKSRG